MQWSNIIIIKFHADLDIYMHMQVATVLFNGNAIVSCSVNIIAVHALLHTIL